MIVPARDIRVGDRFLWPPPGASSRDGGVTPEPAYLTVRTAATVDDRVLLTTHERRSIIWIEADAEMDVDRIQVQ